MYLSSKLYGEIKMVKKMRYLICLLLLVVVNVSSGDLVGLYQLEDDFALSGDTVVNAVSGLPGAWGDGVISDRNAPETTLTYAESVEGIVNRGLYLVDYGPVINGNHIAIDTGNGLIDGSNFTLMGWAKTPATSSTSWRSFMFGQYSSTGETAGNLILSPSDKNNSYKARLFLGTNCPALLSTESYNDNLWHHVAATYDGSVARLYVDGVEVANESFTGIVFNSVSNLAIGNLSNIAAQKVPTTGTYDELRVYTSALTAAEITTIYEQYSYVYIEQTDGETVIAEVNTDDTIIVSLTAEPSADVSITADPNDVDLGSGDGVATVLTFTAANWDQPQTINVSISDDGVDKGIRTDTIKFTMASSDPAFDGISLSDVLVTIYDNDGDCGEWGFLSGDIDENCYIDLDDLRLFIADWLGCTTPGDASCDYRL
jgi:hypothetical protein